MRAKGIPERAGVSAVNGTKGRPRPHRARPPRTAFARPQADSARIATLLAAVLAVALGLRLWGIGQGLPYVYNVDEYGHFVPEAIAMFHHGLNPHYFVNPPALTYLFHLIDAVWLIGTDPAREFARRPQDVYLVARVTVALLGTLSVWLVYVLGARLFDRAVGLLAAALMAVAFLPVYYGHLALNDAPTLVPLTLSLLGAAGVLAAWTHARLPARGRRARASRPRPSTRRRSRCSRCWRRRACAT